MDGSGAERYEPGQDQAEPNSIESAMILGLQKDFEPRGDLPTIQELLEVKDVINCIQNMKQIFTQVSLQEAYQTLARLAAPDNQKGEVDKAMQAKLEQDAAVVVMKLMSQGRLGSPHSVKIDERTGTLVFEDGEVQFSLIDKEKHALAQKSEFI